jgi:hypothetical protein
MGIHCFIQKGSIVRIMAHPYNGNMTGTIAEVHPLSSLPYIIELDNGWTVPYQMNEVLPVAERQERIA